MKLKSILSTIVVFSLLVTSNVYAYACSSENTNNYGISLLDFCVEEGCTSLIQIQTICNLDRTYGGSRTHKCGFLWQDTCNIDGYYATTTDYCPGCGHLSAPYGNHYCLEIHSKCFSNNNGRYNVCPFGGQL